MSERSRHARRAAFVVAGAHTAWALVGVRSPRRYGIALGPAADGKRVRSLAALDALMAGSVALAAGSGRPLRTRLLIGATSDVARAGAVAAGLRDAPPLGRRIWVLGSVAGGAAAAALAVLVDR